MRLCPERSAHGYPRGLEPIPGLSGRRLLVRLERPCADDDGSRNVEARKLSRTVGVVRSMSERAVRYVAIGAVICCTPIVAAKIELGFDRASAAQPGTEDRLAPILTE
jgi:hypothetical protein